MSDRTVLAFENDCGDGVQFTILNDEVRIDCHSDWAGDSETGFGAEVGFTIDRQQADDLLRALRDWLAPTAT